MAKINPRSQPPWYGNPSIPTANSLSASPGAVPFGSGYSSFGGGPNLGIIIPPGGFVGFGQQTPAVQAMFARWGRVGGMRSAARRRRKRRKTASATRVRRRRSAAPRVRRRRRSSSRRPARLVKGSAAAKRYMAKIRRKRRR